jgi:16S rRNA (guanine966-N2)-methyltransferase
MKTPRFASPTKATTPTTNAHRLRIIGGQWRGTRLQFPEHAAIRPTPDRVRETLFNWLQQAVVGARCLDLFAGSGALGLEALSRGAASAVFVEREPVIGNYLRETLARLQCNTAEIYTLDAVSYLNQVKQPFDLVFLDPPFANAESRDWLMRLFQHLEASDCLQANAWIYLECPSCLGLPATWAHWPTQWHLYRSEQTGQVGYHLARRSPPDASTP